MYSYSSSDFYVPPDYDKIYKKWALFIYILGFLTKLTFPVVYVIFQSITNKHGIPHVNLMLFYKYINWKSDILYSFIWFLLPILGLFYTFCMSVGGYVAFVVNYLMFLRIIFFEDGSYISENSQEEAKRKDRKISIIAFIIYTLIVWALNFYFTLLIPDNSLMTSIMSIFFPITALVYCAPTILSYVFGIYYWVGIFLCLAGFAGMRKAQLTGRL